MTVVVDVGAVRVWVFVVAVIVVDRVGVVADSVLVTVLVVEVEVVLEVAVAAVAVSPVVVVGVVCDADSVVPLGVAWGVDPVVLV